MKLVLIRHAESMGNIDKSLYYSIPDRHISLSEKGIGQAMQISEELLKLQIDPKLSQIYCSTFKRAIETSHYAGFLNNDHSVKFNEKLIEVNWGCFGKDDSHFLPQFELWQRDPVNYRYIDGENFLDVAQRSKEFLFELYGNHKIGETLIVVSHGLFLQSLLYSLKRMTIELAAVPSLQNASVTVVEINEKIELIP